MNAEDHYQKPGNSNPPVPGYSADPTVKQSSNFSGAAPRATRAAVTPQSEGDTA